MLLSRIATAVQPSVTLQLNTIAARLKAAGEPVIHLGGGEPTSKASPAGLKSAQDLLNTGEIRYGPEDGIPALKQAVCEYTKTWYGRDVTTDNVCISAGTKQAVMVCMQSILDPGDELIILAPYWASYSEMVQICGATPVIVTPRAALQPHYDDIVGSLTAKTRGILLNSPNNPSGVVYPREQVARLVKLCEDRGIFLMVDDIYQRLLFDDRKPLSVYEFSSAPINDSRIVVFNGVSKAYAMTGFRIGWGIANPTLRKAMAALQGQQTSGPSAVGQAAAIGALRGPQDSVQELCRALQANRDLLVERLERIPGVQVTRPDGAFYCFPDFSAIERDSMRLAQFLLETVRVVTVPGIAFGLEGHLRLSTCGSTRDVIDGCERIAWALNDAAGRETTIGGVRFVRPA